MSDFGISEKRLPENGGKQSLLTNRDGESKSYERSKGRGPIALLEGGVPIGELTSRVRT